VTAASWEPVDPFDLPEWLGTDAVVWSADSGLYAGFRVAGSLSGDGRESIGCDLLAVDEAYPAPVCEEALRGSAHEAWRRGEVFLASIDGRLVLAVPGTGFDADRALDAIARLARAVGSRPSAYAVLLRPGD